MILPLVPILIQIAVAVALMALSILLTPRPKAAATEAQDLEAPKASAGTPIPVVFGTKTVSGVNVLWYGEKTTARYKVK